jgi:hypothetical protein
MNYETPQTSFPFGFTPQPCNDSPYAHCKTNSQPLIKILLLKMLNSDLIDLKKRKRAKELIFSILAKSELRDKYLRVLYGKLSSKPKRKQVK